MEINLELLRKNVDHIHDSLKRLEQTKHLSLDAYLADQDEKDVSCFKLIVVIEDALSICFHIATKILHKVPDGNADCFLLLGENGILSKTLSDSLSRMARFRNLLVHQYWEVDYERIYRFIQEDLDDIVTFLREIEKIIG